MRAKKQNEEFTLLLTEKEANRLVQIADTSEDWSTEIAHAAALKDTDVADLFDDIYYNLIAVIEEEEVD